MTTKSNTRSTAWNHSQISVNDGTLILSRLPSTGAKKTKKYTISCNSVKQFSTTKATPKTTITKKQLTQSLPSAGVYSIYLALWNKYWLFFLTK
jgi:hypothetical protein